MVVADIGIQLTYAILLTATMAFFGVGLDPHNSAIDIRPG
jgi:hypothetical protein